MKKTMKYLKIFIITIVVLFSALVLACTIPKSAIKKNIENSVEFYKKNTGLEVKNTKKFLTTHYYADSVLLNIIYSVDSNSPVESALWSKFYKKAIGDVNKDFIDMVNSDLEPNEQYLRYWHGSIAIIRPMLTVFNIEQIYDINQMLMVILAISLAVIISKRSKKLLIIYMISLIMIYLPTVGRCLEYTWAFYIMFISTIFLLEFEKKHSNICGASFLITGMITCFMDFLTTEILTLFIPLISLLITRYEDGRLNSFKETVILSLKLIILWSCGYIGMWLAKWLIASIVLNINAIDYVAENALLRINGIQGNATLSSMYNLVIPRNFQILYPLNLLENTKVLPLIAICILIIPLLTIDWKNIKKHWILWILLLIALTPYIRYLVLANHSYRHCFFTFRDQMITIIAFSYAVIEANVFKRIIHKVRKSE